VSLRSCGEPRAHPGDDLGVGVHPARVSVRESNGDRIEKAPALGFGAPLVCGALANGHFGFGYGHGESLPVRLGSANELWTQLALSSQSSPCSAA
jgi:hypothetical protein